MNYLIINIDTIKIAIAEKIDFAMKRIETGEYFECIQCGEKIAEKRLEVDPTCSRCIECANN